MPVLISAVVLVGAVCALDLLLSIGVIRRLRVHTTLLDQLRDASATPDVMLPAGAPPGDFAATTVDGERLSAESLGPTLVGFFMPHCGGCAEELPNFVRYARAAVDGPHRPLAVVVAEDDGDEEVAGYIAKLGAVARVVRETPAGPLASAFSVTGFPAFCLVGADRAVVASGHRVDALPAPAAV